MKSVSIFFVLFSPLLYNLSLMYDVLLKYQYVQIVLTLVKLLL